MTMWQTAPPLARTASWREVEEGFWAGSEAGVFVGTIERQGSSFLARNDIAQCIGTCETLDEARTLIETKRHNRPGGSHAQDDHEARG